MTEAQATELERMRRLVKSALCLFAISKDPDALAEVKRQSKAVRQMEKELKEVEVLV